MSKSLLEYFQALDRLKSGRPTRIPKGSRINKDNVSLEAGRGKGSIKKSRAVFKDLIEAIENAAIEQSSPAQLMSRKLENSRSEVQTYREKWEQALCRELSLLQEVYALKKELAKLRNQDVIPLRPNQ
ncbi:MAG: hypothetical protein AB2821_15000 [Candidatus Thiodiazotropha endolucinida]